MEKKLVVKTRSVHHDSGGYIGSEGRTAVEEHCGPESEGLDDQRDSELGSRFLRLAIPILLLGLLFSVPSLANETKNFSLGISAAIGGPFDSDSPDPGLSNSGFSAHFAWRTMPQTKVVVRVAKIDLGDDFLGNLFEPELQYFNVGGEYTFREPYYTSGLYFGLGIYQIDGTLLGGGGLVPTDEQDTSLGAVFGVTADFTLTSQFSIFGDLSFHYADLDRAQFFGFLHVGIAYHF